MSDFVKDFEATCTAVCFIEDRYIREEQKGTVGEGIIGTGFLVHVNSNDTALFATAKHVVDKYSPARYPILELCFSYVMHNGVPTYSRGVMEILKIYHHPCRDVSLILAKPAGKRQVQHHKGDKLVEEIRDVGPQLKEHTPLPFGRNSDIKSGAMVMIIGYGKGTDFVFLDDILGPGSPKALVPLGKHGMICQVVPADARQTEVFLYDTQTAPGFSGSPVVLCGHESIKVIGVHTNGLPGEDVAYAHSIRFVDDLMKDLNGHKR